LSDLARRIVLDQDGTVHKEKEDCGQQLRRSAYRHLGAEDGAHLPIAARGQQAFKWTVLAARQLGEQKLDKHNCEELPIPVMW